MRLVVAGPSAEALALEARRWGHSTVASPDDLAGLLHAITTLHPDVAVVRARSGLLTAELIATADDAGCRLVVLAGSDAERRHAIGLGLFEIVDAARPWSDIEAIASGTAPVAAGGGVRGSVIAVWGPPGAPGRTSVAIALAAELAIEGRRVALADADTHGAAVAPTLGLLDEAPGFAAACRLAAAGGLDAHELERVGQWCPVGTAGFWVLTGIGRPSRWPELGGDRVGRVIDACRDWVDVTVVDTGPSIETDEEIVSDLFAPRRNAATVAAIEKADRVVAVGAADPVGIARLLRAHADLVALCGSETVSVVMNRLRASVIGAAPAAQVQRTLERFGGIRPVALVPDDRGAFDAALLSGRTLAEVAPRSAARAALRSLAASLAPLPAG
ncbi:MAG: regulator [Microbacteriaceae bacterium]